MLFDTLSRDFLKAEAVGSSIKKIYLSLCFFPLFPLSFSFFFFTLSECVGGANKYLSRWMLKVKSNDNEFCVIIIKQTTLKRCLWCTEHPSSECTVRSFCFSYCTAKDSKSIRQEVLLCRVITIYGCICVCECDKVVGNVAMDFFVVVFLLSKWYAWISKDLKGNRLFSSDHTGFLIPLRCFVRKLKGLTSPALPKAVCGYSKISQCSPGIAAKYWGFVRFTTQCHST